MLEKHSVSSGVDLGDQRCSPSVYPSRSRKDKDPPLCSVSPAFLVPEPS